MCLGGWRCSIDFKVDGQGDTYTADIAPLPKA
jgi:hypothetical protein